MKKKVWGMLALAMLAALLAVGCGSGDSDDDSSVAVDESAEKWPEEVTVTWWLVGGSDNYYQTYWSEMKGLQAIQESVGIDIEFQVAVSYDSYLAMMTAKTYPDVITANNLSKYPGRMSGMYTDGVSIDLTPYMEEYMPNFSAILEEYPDMARDLRLDDGSYTFVSTLYDINDDDDRIAASEYGLALRKDWLDAVGLDVPTNMEEWYTVLTAFKTQDPNSNGERDEIPICMASSCWKYFLPAYGIDDDPSISTDADGNETVIYGYMTDAYKEYLAELNKWYTDGLFENMFENTSLETLKQTVVNNLAGAWKGKADDFDEDSSDSYLNTLTEKAPDAEFVAAPWPETEDGYQWCFSDINSFDTDTTVITDNAIEDGVAEAAAYLIDYMLSENGSTYLTWGIEGESYTVNEDGEKELVDGMDEMVTFEDTEIVTFNLYADPTTVVFPSFGELSNYILQGKKEAYVDACTTWAQGDTSYKMPAACQLTSEVQTEIDDLENTMKDYITKMRNRFITGTEPLTNYDTYVSNVERLGADEYIEIWQEAYDAYMAR